MIRRPRTTLAQDQQQLLMTFLRQRTHHTHRRNHQLQRLPPPPPLRVPHHPLVPATPMPNPLRPQQRYFATFPSILWGLQNLRCRCCRVLPDETGPSDTPRSSTTSVWRVLCCPCLSTYVLIISLTSTSSSCRLVRHRLRPYCVLQEEPPCMSTITPSPTSPRRSAFFFFSRGCMLDGQELNLEDRTKDELLQPFLVALHVSPLLLLSGSASSGRNRCSWMTLFAVRALFQFVCATFD